MTDPPATLGPYGGIPVQTHGAPLYVEALGSGDPVLFIHGFGANSYTWKGWATRISTTHRVLLADMKGFGRAPKPDEPTYGPVDLAEGVVEFILRENLTQLVLVGHSLGGGVALLVALQLIEIGEVNRLRGLVLIAAASLPQKLPLFMKLGRIPIVGAIGIRILPARLLVALALRFIVFDPSTVTSEAVLAYSWALQTQSGRRAALRGLQSILPRDAELIAKRFPDITLPVLALWGRQDRVVPLWVGKELVRRLPMARLTILEDCGHMLPEEQCTEGLREVLRFLQEVEEGVEEAP